MTRLYYAAAVVLIVLAFCASALLYPRLPQTVPIHWNIHGEVDGYGDKSLGLFLMPVLMVLLLGLIRALPWLSPRSFGIDRFRSTWLFIMVAVIGSLGYVHAIMLWTLWRGPIDMLRATAAGLFFFFALCGNVLGRVRRNFFIGVRTPWTLASERVWTDTHRMAARLMVASGVLGAAAILAGMPGWMSIALILFVCMIPVVYSLVLYKRLERRGEV